MTERYSVVYTSAARRQMNRLPLSAAVAIHEHLMGPVADNPRRLGKQLDAPYEGCGAHAVVSTARSTPSMRTPPSRRGRCSPSGCLPYAVTVGHKRPHPYQGIGGRDEGIRTCVAGGLGVHRCAPLRGPIGQQLGHPPSRRFAARVTWCARCPSLTAALLDLFRLRIVLRKFGWGAAWHLVTVGHCDPSRLRFVPDLRDATLWKYPAVRSAGVVRSRWLPSLLL